MTLISSGDLIKVVTMIVDLLKSVKIVGGFSVYQAGLLSIMILLAWQVLIFFTNRVGD